MSTSFHELVRTCMARSRPTLGRFTNILGNARIMTISHLSVPKSPSLFPGMSRMYGARSCSLTGGCPEATHHVRDLSFTCQWKILPLNKSGTKTSQPRRFANESASILGLLSSKPKMSVKSTKARFLEFASFPCSAFV